MRIRRILGHTDENAFLSSSKLNMHTHKSAVANLPTSVAGPISPYPTVVPVITVKYAAFATDICSICVKSNMPTPSAHNPGPITPPGIFFFHEHEKSMIGPQNIPRPQKAKDMMKI